MDLIKRRFYIAPRPDIIFLVDLSEEIAYQRKNDTPSIKYLRERRKIYLNIGKEFGMVTLNGEDKLEKIMATIQKEISNRLRID